MSIFKPDRFIESVLRLDPDELVKSGKKGILLDVDNTLKEHYAASVNDEIKAFLVLARIKGLRSCIVSNGETERIKKIAESLNVQMVGKAHKPVGRGFKHALIKLGIKNNEAIVVGDQIFTDILGGNLTGCETVLVKPISKKEPWYVRMKRFFEFFILLRMKPEEDKRRE